MDEQAREQQAVHDTRDNRRAFRWSAVAAAVVVVLVLGYNMVSHQRDGSLSPEATTSTQRQQTPAPAAGGGNNNAAGPGTAGGTSTGAQTGTGEPGQPGK